MPVYIAGCDHSTREGMIILTQLQNNAIEPSIECRQLTSPEKFFNVDLREIIKPVPDV